MPDEVGAKVPQEPGTPAHTADAPDRGTLTARDRTYASLELSEAELKYLVIHFRDLDALLVSVQGTPVRYAPVHYTIIEKLRKALR